MVVAAIKQIAQIYAGHSRYRPVADFTVRSSQNHFDDIVVTNAYLYYIGLRKCRFVEESGLRTKLSYRSLHPPPKYSLSRDLFLSFLIFTFACNRRVLTVKSAAKIVPIAHLSLLSV